MAVSAVVRQLNFGIWRHRKIICVGSGFGCAPPLLACMLGCVCDCARPLLVPRHSWLGCAALVCVLELRFWLQSATVGWCVGVCVCVYVQAPFVPYQSWVGCAVWVCVLGLGFWLRPATPASGVGACVCVCVSAPLVPCHSWLGCAVWVYVLELGFRLRPATLGWGVEVCVCFCARSACTPAVLAGVCGVGVCAWAQILAAPRHSWLG